MSEQTPKGPTGLDFFPDIEILKHDRTPLNPLGVEALVRKPEKVLEILVERCQRYDQNDNYRPTLVNYVCDVITRNPNDWRDSHGDTIREAINIAFGNPQNEDNSERIHYPFITSIEPYRSIFRQTGNLLPGDAVEFLINISGYLQPEALAYILEDMINGSTYDQWSNDERDYWRQTSTRHLPDPIHYYGQIVKGFASRIRTKNASNLMPTLSCLVARADSTTVYTITHPQKPEPTVEDITKRDLVLDSLESALVAPVYINRFFEECARQDRDWVIDNRLFEILRKAQTRELGGTGVLAFLESVYLHEADSYDLRARVILYLQSLPDCPYFRASGLHTAAADLVTRLIQYTQSTERLATLGSLKGIFSQIQPETAQSPIKHATK